jgi:hypothetical protein
MASEQIEEYLKRPARYNMIDGTNEIGIGLIMSGMVLFNWLHAISPEDSVWHWNFFPVLCLWMLCVALLGAGAVFKRRVTYRRTGFVRYRASAGLKGIIEGMVGGAIGVAAVYALSMRHTEHAMALLGGLGMAALYAYATNLDRPWRWPVLVLIALGPRAVYVLPLNGRAQDNVGTSLIGLCWLLSGAITLCTYLRNTELPQQDAQ